MTYTYKLYGKAEIGRDWGLYRELNLKGIMGNERYFSCIARCKDEALVLTALLIREICNSPANFYYSEKWKRLFMCCYSTEMSNEAIELHYSKIVLEFTGGSCLKNLISDSNGQPLFRNLDVEMAEIEEFVSGNCVMGTLKAHLPMGVAKYPFPLRF